MPISGNINNFENRLHIPQTRADLIYYSGEGNTYNPTFYEVYHWNREWLKRWNISATGNYLIIGPFNYSGGAAPTGQFWNNILINWEDINTDWNVLN